MNSIQSSPYVSKIHRLNASQLSNGLRPSLNSSFTSTKSFCEGSKKKDKLFSTPQRPIASTKRSASCNCTADREKKDRTLDDIIKTNKSKEVKYFAEMIQMLNEKINRMEMGKSSGIKRKREKEILSVDFETPKKLEKMQDTIYYPTVNCDYSTDVEDSSSSEEEEEENNSENERNQKNHNKKSQQQQPHSPYRHIEKIFKDYEMVQKEFTQLNKRLQSANCTKEDKQTIIDRLEELTALTQSLQEEYKLSIKWNKEHGLSSEGVTDKNNTPIDKHINNYDFNNNNYNEDNDDDDDDDNYRTISDITDDLNQVDVLYNSFKDTLKRCKVSNWSRNMLHILQKRFDDLTEELNHTKLHIKSDMKLSENSINNAIELLNKLDYLVRSAESIHKDSNNNEQDKQEMKKIYVEINFIVKSLLACEDIQNTELITVVQGISSNIKSISPAYDILKDSIMKLKKLLESNNNSNNSNNRKNEIVKPSQYQSYSNPTATTTSTTATSTVRDFDSIGKLLKEAEYVQEQYNLLKDELNRNPSPQRMMEIQSSLTRLMRRANNLENDISIIKTSTKPKPATNSNSNNDYDLTPLGIEKRLTELSEKYEELCYRIKNCKNDEDKEKLKYEINRVLEETKSLNERISQMKPEEKESMKNQLQNILISGVKCCKEECSGREERYGFLTDYYKKYLPITSDKMLKEFVDLGMQLCSTEMA